MQGQMTAHKATLETVRDTAEKKRQTELDSERLNHANKLGKQIKAYHKPNIK